MKNNTYSGRYFKNILSILLVLILVVGCNKPKTKQSKVEASSETESNSDFQLSLAQWSLHKAFFGKIKDWNWFKKTLKKSPESLLQGKLDPMNFPEIAAGYGIYCIELVNTFYFDKARDKEFLQTFKQKCDNAGVKVGLIMCDALGDLGDKNPRLQQKAVENHFQWIDAAKYLGAHSIRVNIYGKGTKEKLAKNVIKSLTKLGEYGAQKGINILVENHGGYSSDASWLADVIKQTGLDNVGTLPDFGNFCIKRGSKGCENEYDRYKGMEELMPYAKSVSAKSYAFDENGNETKIDYFRMMKIVKDSGYKGYIGIEYEGKHEDEGIKATKKLLEKIFKQL